LAAYFFIWGLFTFAMFFGTLKKNRALQFVFLSLAILFFLLMVRELTANVVLFGSVTINTLLGYEGVICGLSAVYLAIAEVLNETYEKTILPICPTS
jgi:succinate-acetate transporter protein